MYFEEKGINWDSIYTIYTPKTKAIKNDQDLRNTFLEIIRLFQDGHLWVHTTDSMIITSLSPILFYEDNTVDRLLADGFELRHSEL